MAKGLKVNGLRVAKARTAMTPRPSQAEFAQRVGIHWVTQSNIENGKAKVSLELLERIAEATGKTREHFLGEDEEEAAQVVVPLLGDLVAVLLEALQASARAAARDEYVRLQSDRQVAA